MSETLLNPSVPLAFVVGVCVASENARSHFFFVVNNVVVPIYSVLLGSYFMTQLYFKLSSPNPNSSSTTNSGDGNYTGDLKVANDDGNNDKKESEKEQSQSSAMPVLVPKISPNNSHNPLHPPPMIMNRPESVVDLSGTYKLSKNVKFAEFLQAQGVPWALRCAADKVKPIHTLTHRGDQLRVQISGIVTGDTTYHIGGKKVTPSTLRDRHFNDTATYLEGGDGIRVQKVASDIVHDNAKEFIVTRQLTKDRKQIIMRSWALFPDNRETVGMVQYFDRIESP
mmetsp:Transcript_3508/g.4878  ORF Transcript_3508/g.4878 Transcript_3508/m.4878 type:complete len:282 (-) Transcript_3508:48-893(-)